MSLVIVLVILALKNFFFQITELLARRYNLDSQRICLAGDTEKLSNTVGSSKRWSLDAYEQDSKSIGSRYKSCGEGRTPSKEQRRTKERLQCCGL
uniref:Secreted protein n=1 Tax=Steinernema glaseri TaxID=37863 RepID=A0A1I7YXI6_9BILA